MIFFQEKEKNNYKRKKKKCVYKYLADRAQPEPGAALQRPLLLINSVSNSSFVKISLWCRDVQQVRDGVLSHNIDYGN